MTVDGYLSLFPADYPTGRTPRPGAVVIVRRPGVDGAQVADRLEQAGITYDPAALDTEAVLETIVSVDPTSTESVPNLLGLLMVTTSSGVLLYGLAVAIGGSRRDLAVARALGFDRHLVRQTARWVGAS
jgi:hypothetical protein